MSRIRILIVEDEAITRTEIAARLQRLGYDVAGATSSGEGAVHMARQLAPDLVLMDITLSGDLDGIQAGAAIRERHHIPVIYLTADSEPKTLERVKLADPFGYLVKPFENVDLRSAIEIALYKHQLDMRLREAEEHYRTIFENSLVGLYRSTLQGHIISVNHALASMLGYDSPTQLMTLLRDIESQLYVEDGRRAEFLRLLQERGHVERFESQVYGRDGDLLWVSQSARLVGHGKARHIDGAFIDITARKEAESAYKATFDLLGRTIDSISDMVAVTDLEGNIVLANQALAKAFSLTDAEIRTSRYQDLMHRGALPESVGHKGHSRLIEHAELGGSFQEHASPFQDMQGNIIGVVRVVRNVTDLVKNE